MGEEDVSWFIGPPFPDWFTWADLALGVIAVVAFTWLSIYAWVKK